MESTNNQTQFRTHVIMFLYQRELLQKRQDPFDEEYNFDAQEINAIDWIVKKYDLLKQRIVEFLKDDWPWERLMPLERAILLFATFELNIRDKKIVINEAVNYAKNYISGDKYKFINSILDKIGQKYGDQKTKRS